MKDTHESAQALVDALKEIATNPVSTLDAFHTVGHTLLHVRRVKEALAEAKLEETRPHRQALDAANEKYKSLGDLEELERNLKDSLANFVDERLVAALVEAQLAAASSDATRLYLANRPIPRIPGLEFRTVKQVFVDDLALLPDKYVVKGVSPEVKKLAVRNVEIPGVRVVEKTQVAISSDTADRE